MAERYARAMTLRGPVLVGTDLSSEADEALRQGAALARDLRSTMSVCHVVPELLPDGSVFSEFHRANAGVEESVLEKARAAVQEQLDTVLGPDNAGVDVLIEFGTPHAGLLSQADATGAGIIVLAPGSVAVDVARHVSTAVLIVRRSARGPVIGATDFSDASRPALQAAAAEARRRNSELHLLHAFDTAAFAMHAPGAAMPYLVGISPIALDGVDDLRGLAANRLEDTLREMAVAGRTEVLDGAAADVIVRYAENVKAELVVAGTHGRSGLARLTLGSTAVEIIEESPCSVLVVR